MKHFCSIALFLAVAFSLAGAEMRIGVVNVEKVFREYYKSRIAEDTIKQQARVFRDYLRRLNEQLLQLTDRARQARTNAMNLALSESERAQAEQQARQAARLVTEKRAELELYSNERNADMRKLETRKRQEIMADINRQIRRSAAAFGYDFVLDSSGKTLNQQPALMVYPAGRDFTASVITELNRTGMTDPKSRGK